ncbi:MAG: hypothetical protein ABUK01_03865 [Leptospirales bacterium]
MFKTELFSIKIFQLNKFFISTLVLSGVSVGLFAASVVYETKPLQVKRYDEIVSRANLFHPRVKAVAMAKWPNTIVFQNIDTWKQMGVIKAHSTPERIIYSMTFSPTGKYIAAGMYDTKTKKSMVTVWEVEQNKLVANYNILCTPDTIDFSSDGKFIAVAGSYERVKGAAQLIDIDKGSIKTIWSTKSYEEWTATQIKFLPKSKVLAIAMVNKKRGILFYNTETSKTDFFPTKTDTYAIDFTQDAKFMVSGGGNEKSGNEILVWNLDTKKVITELKGHSSFVNSVKFTPNGKQVVSSAFEKGTRFRFWDIESAKEIQSVKTDGNRSKSMSISANGQYLVFEVESFGNAGNPITMEFFIQAQQ